MTLKGKRTLIFAVLLIVAGGLEAKWKLLQPFLTPETYGISLVIIGAIVAILRALTTTPLFMAWLDADGDQSWPKESGLQ